MSTRIALAFSLAGFAVAACTPADAPQAPAPAAYELALVSLDGTRETLGTLPGTVYAPRLSHEGLHVVFDDNAGETPTLYLAALDDIDGRRALPSLDGGNSFPLWSFDDEQILSIATRDGEQALFAQPSDGERRHELIASPARAPEAWTPDGRHLNFITRLDGDYAISRWDRYERSASRLVQRAGSLQHSSVYSPDGRWLAYASNETGRFELWAEPRPSTGERFQVTHGGGEHPLWSPDGTRIVFDRAAELFSVAVSTADGRFEAGEPEALPIKGFAQLPGLRRQFDMAPDGRLLMLFAAE